jgi:hypothetical protein
MTDTPETLSGTECNGDRPPENGQQPSSQTRQETTDADETQAYYKVEPSLEDLPAKENQEETGNTKGNILPKGPEDEKILNGKVFLFLSLIVSTYKLFKNICIN